MENGENYSKKKIKGGYNAQPETKYHKKMKEYVYYSQTTPLAKACFTFFNTGKDFLQNENRNKKLHQWEIYIHSFHQLLQKYCLD